MAFACVVMSGLLRQPDWSRECSRYPCVFLLVCQLVLNNKNDNACIDNEADAREYNRLLIDRLGDKNVEGGRKAWKDLSLP